MSTEIKKIRWKILENKVKEIAQKGEQTHKRIWGKEKRAKDLEASLGWPTSN